MKYSVRHIHFVGLGGAGMSGIAEVLCSMGYVVSGSDMFDSAVLQRLAARGVRIHVGHAADQVVGADVVVISSAVQADNPEVLHARTLGIAVISRAEMLAELMRFKRGIAVAGTHGKTTTTSLVTSVLLQAGLEPTFVIGGWLHSSGANAQLGRGEYIVVEADESDASFLQLTPLVSVVTNIDADHMETYGQDFDQLKTAFVQFLQRMPFYGAAILCTDDPGVQSIVPQLTRPVTTYGLNEGAALRAVNVRAVGRQMHFTVLREKPLGCADLPVVLNLTGLHNVRNALAAMAVAAELRIADDAVLQALAQFQGVGRRFECYGELPLPTGGTVALIDDYGHHPVEIEATLAAARGAYPGRRLVLAFQPHRYTRTRDLLADFVRVLGAADVVLLTEVYGAGESPIAGADGAALFQALRSAGKQESLLVEDIAAMPAALVETARAGDVLLCMGAGSIGEVPAAIARLLSITELSTQEVCRL